MTPTTLAGRDLYAFWRLHQEVAHGVKDVHDALEDDVAAIEHEAAAAARTALLDELGAAIEALPGTKFGNRMTRRTLYRHEVHAELRRRRP